MNHLVRTACFLMVALAAVAIGNSKGADTVEAETKQKDAAIVWKKFSPELLEQETANGKSVMLVFVADWCAVCQVYKKKVFNTADVRKLMAEKRVVPIMVDLTEPSPEESEALKKFGAAAIPTTVIFSADNPKKPQVFLGVVQQKKLVGLLKKLVPSMRDPPTRNDAPS